MFIAYDGSVLPSGFLPVRTGNVRSDDIVELYRTHPVFTSLRDVTTYKGRCGRCDYAWLCGGSRARAYTWTGDFLEFGSALRLRPAASPHSGPVSWVRRQ